MEQKVCIGASAGGHMNELFSLLESYYGKKIYSNVFITTDSLYKGKLAEKYDRVYVIGECNRVTIFRIPHIAFKAFITARKEKPNLVITTGSFPLAIFCRFAKSFGAKIIWIDSIANIKELTLSGKWVLKFGDRVYTQWPELCSKYKKLYYAGYLL